MLKNALSRWATKQGANKCVSVETQRLKKSSAVRFAAKNKTGFQTGNPAVPAQNLLKKAVEYVD
jgi:hypothetical protein